MSPSPTSAQVLDLAHLARQTFGDRHLERELLALFEQQCVRLLPLLASGPSIERADAAHTLKGAARAIGASRAAALADALEAALDDDLPPETIARLTEKLERALREVRRAIAARWREAA